MAALLLHSLKEFDEVIFELLDSGRPRSVLEIGAETGEFSERLIERCEGIGARFTSIDPHPPEHLMRRAQTSTTFDLVVGLSLPYLRKHGCEHDFVLIDGDHNYFTVSNELELVHASCAAHDACTTPRARFCFTTSASPARVATSTTTRARFRPTPCTATAS